MLSYISFEFLFLEYYSFQLKWGHWRWCLVTISYNTAVSGCSGLAAPQVHTALYLTHIYWAYLQHRLFPGILWYTNPWVWWLTHIYHAFAIIAFMPGILWVFFSLNLRLKKERKKSPAKFIFFIATQCFGLTFQGHKQTTNETIYKRGHSWSHLPSQKQTNKHCPKC